MNLSLLLFTGIHLISLGIAAAVIFEYKRVRKNRAVLFAQLQGTNKNVAEGYLLMTFYALTTLLIVAISLWLLFQSLPS